jgi:prepilin-type N-terminal cleavage/methylation domain-containing protein
MLHRTSSARPPGFRGFTLIELLVVVAIIALLISILLPALNGAREQGKRATCLANIKSIATAMHAYAGEDSKELIIPIHPMMVRNTVAVHPSWWMWRTANWFAWGGRTPPKRFLTNCANEGSTGCGPLLGDTGALSIYAARNRPLNKYVYGQVSESDEKKMEMFHCPSDEGYPDSPQIDDSPPANAKRSCYDTLGSSYRASLFAFFPAAGGSYTGAYAIGPWGKRLSTLQSTSRLILFGEPSFFNMIGMDDGTVNPDPVVVLGQHKKRMVDNIAFVDGSARSTQADGRENITDPQVLQQMGAAGAGALLSRGPTWTFDTYPTPGARIWGTSAPWVPPYNGFGIPVNSWPIRGTQRNLE